MLDLGLSLVDISISMKSVYSENRKLRDQEAPRAFFIQDPVWLQVNGLNVKEAEVPVHPDFEERGVRKIPLIYDGDTVEIGIQPSDLKRLKSDKIFRLKDLANLSIVTKKPPVAKFDSLDVEEVRKVDGQIIHWIPKIGAVPVEMTLIDGSNVMGLAEPNISSMDVGTFLQFERVGFARITEGGETIKVSFAHK
jgi:glutamyl-tRNA synthetase